MQVFQHESFNECTYDAISQNYYDNFSAIFILDISYFIRFCNVILISL